MSAYDFDERFLAELRSAVDLVEVVSDVVPLKKAGKSFMGLCPFHGEKSASFSVDRDKGLYYCFGCGVGGDALRFVMETEKLDFPDACEQLARRFHVPLPALKEGRGATRRRDELETLRQVLTRTQRIFREELGRSGAEAVAYLDRRGISAETREELGFGWAVDRWDRVTGELKKDFTEADLERAGVAIRHPERKSLYDRFRGRVTVPIHDARGGIVGFGGRILGDGEPKYLNSPEGPLFDKSTTLFNLHRARAAARGSGRILLVEGYFDAISLLQGGFTATVATLGTSLTERHAQELRRLGVRVVVCYDGDAAGIKAAARSLPILLGRDLDVRVAVLPEGLDPDALLLRDGGEALESRLQAALEPVDFLLGLEPDLGSPAGRRAAAARVVEILAVHPDRVWAYAATERLAERLALPMELLWKPESKRRFAAAQEAAPERLESGERRVLSLMVRSAEARLEGIRVLEEGDFENSAHREIFLALKDRDRSEGALDFRVLIAHLNTDAAAAALAALALEGGPDEQPGELGDTITLLQRRSLRRRGENLQGEIHRLQSSGEDPARVDALLKAKLELERRRQAMTQKRRERG